jgi:formyltetrahydrofolate deformylase
VGVEGEDAPLVLDTKSRAGAGPRHTGAPICSRKSRRGGNWWHMGGRGAGRPGPRSRPDVQGSVWGMDPMRWPGKSGKTPWVLLDFSQARGVIHGLKRRIAPPAGARRFYLETVTGARRGRGEEGGGGLLFPAKAGSHAVGHSPGSSQWKPQESRPPCCITCPDKRAALAAGSPASSIRTTVNITALDLAIHRRRGRDLFMRFWTFQIPYLDGYPGRAGERLRHGVVASASPMDWRHDYGADTKRVAIWCPGRPLPPGAHVALAGRAGRSWDMPGHRVVSNHPTTARAMERFGLPTTTCRWRAGTRPRPRPASWNCLRADTDLVVLARYMQFLSPEFVSRLPGPHHQHPPLLPAGVHSGPTPSARPTTGREAHRGHGPYVTEELGRGPHHRAGRGPGVAPPERARPEELGRDLERQGSGTGLVRAHLDDRIIIFGIQDVVF